MIKPNKIYLGDCLEVLKTIPDNCINLILTSPPYYNLRQYSDDNSEIGQENQVADYLNSLYDIFDQAYRVLKDDGSLWVNIDDVYSKKCLMCIPDRFKIGMIERKWICRNEIIWQKPNTMPCSVKDRFNNDYEKFFFFVKSKKYKFKTQYEPMKYYNINTNGHMSHNSKYSDTYQESSVRQGMNFLRGSNIVYKRYNLPSQSDFVSFLKNRTDASKLSCVSGINKSTIEHWFRTDSSGFSYPKIEDWMLIRDVLNDNSDEFNEIDRKIMDVTEESDTIMKNSKDGRIKRSVWSICTKHSDEKHFAIFPEELCKTPILSCTDNDDIVLDPFCGSGTTCKVAYELRRKYIGIEKVKEYYDISVKKLSSVKSRIKII